jgi:TolA-binding protein
MASPQQRNLVTRLADAGEEAMQRLGEAPGGERLVGAVNSMRERVDEMQKKLRGLDEIDKRLRAIERRLDKLEGKASTGTRKRATSSTREEESS